ncbi:MAG TPA: ATP-grasp domain-containing protein, partial [Methanosarcina sp.]|nr:ATP-grasp domain-containing protein [Methanosarcina sp.]
RIYEAGKMPTWTQIWYSKKYFSQDQYRFSLGNLLLNHSARYTTYGKIKHTRFDYPVFMKPSSDLKDFDGCIVMPEDTLEREISNGRRSKYLTNDTIVLYAPELNIEKEFRCFVVGGEIIDISSYKQNDKVQWQVPTSEERQQCQEFFEEVSLKYRPDECYVVDFCLSNGEMKVIEYNCIHCSGFYTCDISKILYAITSFIEKETKCYN